MKIEIYARTNELGRELLVYLRGTETVGEKKIVFHKGYNNDIPIIICFMDFKYHFCQKLGREFTIFS